MARQILPTLDLRTLAQRQGITKTQQTVQSILGILKTVGAAEQVRRNRQTLDRVTRAITSGATTIEAISAAATQAPEFGGGLRGGLQRFGGMFQPSPGGIGQDIQQSIISSALQRALTPQFLTQEEQRTGALVKAGIEPRAAAPSLKAIGIGEKTGVFDPTTGKIVETEFPSARVPSTTVTVSTGVEKTTRAKLERDIIDLEATLGELGAIEPQFDEDFFTYRGRAKSFFAGLAEKAEIPVAQATTEFLKKRTKFFADSKRVFLKFRKFITGVAGGIEEFREIAKATIDPESDSPTQFKAKFVSMRDNAIRVRNLMMAIRNSGLDTDDKSTVEAALNLVPLSKVPLSIDENATLESLSGQPAEQAAPEPPSAPVSEPTVSMQEYQKDFDAWQRLTAPEIWGNLPPKTANNIIELLKLQQRWSEIIRYDDVRTALERK